MVLVVGATGLLGSQICRLLANRDEPWKALVRSTCDPGKRRRLQDLGGEIAVGDLKDPASLTSACEGVSAVISTASSTLSRQEGDSIQTVDLDGQLSLIDAAETAGVEHFAYASFRHHLNPGLQYPLKAAKRQVEKRIVDSALAHTILQASCFMEIWLSPALGFDPANATARIYGDGHNPLSWVSSSDVAKFAVAALDNPAAQNAVLEIGGPEPLSPLEVVRIFEEIEGRKFDLEHIPVQALEAQKASAKDPLQETFAGLMLFYAGGDPIAMDDTLRKFPVELTSVQDYAKQMTRRVPA